MSAVLPISFKVHPSKLGLYELKLGRLMGEVVKRGQTRAAMETLRLLKEGTQNAIPASRYGHRGAIDTRSFYNGWEVMHRGRTVTVTNNAKHAVYVERGRLPGKAPPSAALVPWVIRNLGVDEREARGLAFVIARAIGRRGLRGRHILEKALPAIKRVHMREVERALDTALVEASR